MLRHSHLTYAGAASQAGIDRPDGEIPAAIRYAEQHGYAGLLMPGKPDKTPRVTFRNLRESTPAHFRRWLWLCDNRWDDDQVWLLRTGILRRGHPVPLVVLDADSAAGVALLQSDRGYATPWQVATPRAGGGLHNYYAAGPGVDRCSYGIDGIDVKTGMNSYVVAPLSVTAAGVYTPSPTFGRGIPPTITLEMLEDLKRKAPRQRRPRRNLHTPPDATAGESELKPVAPERPKPPPERPQYAPREDAPKHKAPVCVDPARCTYQTPCIGTRNTTIWTVCSRRVMRNYLIGDKRVSANQMLAYARAVNANNFGHDVAPGEERHTLKDSEIREMLPRICEAVAEAYGERGYRDSQKRCSNLAHYTKEELRVAVYAAIWDGYQAGMSVRELQLLSAEFRVWGGLNGRPYCGKQIRNIIGNRGVYQRPRLALPEEELPAPPPLKYRHLPKHQWRNPPPLEDNPPPLKVDTPVAIAPDSGQPPLDRIEIALHGHPPGPPVTAAGYRRRRPHPRDFPQWAMPESRGPAKKRGGGRRKKRLAAESVAESQPGLPAGLSVADTPPEVSMPAHVHPPLERPIVTTLHTCHECRVSYLWRVSERRWVKTAYQPPATGQPPPAAR